MCGSLVLVIISILKQRVIASIDHWDAIEWQYIVNLQPWIMQIPPVGVFHVTMIPSIVFSQPRHSVRGKWFVSNCSDEVACSTCQSFGLAGSSIRGKSRSWCFVSMLFLCRIGLSTCKFKSKSYLYIRFYRFY
jgi:hypothetical protein